MKKIKINLDKIKKNIIKENVETDRLTNTTIICDYVLSQHTRSEGIGRELMNQFKK